MNALISVLAVIAMVWGGFIYYFVYELSLFESIYSALALLFANIQTPSGTNKDIVEWYQNIYLPGILALVVLSLAVVSLYVRLAGSSISRLLKKVKFWNRILVIGLGEGNRAYIDSEIDVGNKNIIVIEINKNNPYIDQYAKKVLVEIADASHKSTLERFNFFNIKHVVISTGEDITNINIASAILDKNRDTKLFLHLTDRSLRHYHKENGVLSGKNIRVFSYYEESARELFLNHDIDGESSDVIHSHNDYAIVVIGDTILAREVVAQACIIGQLPNENKLTIYCIDKEIKSFKDGIELDFTNISSIPNVSLEYKNLDYNTIDFYKQDIWKDKVTNIIVCYEDEKTNLDIAANLINIQLLDEAVDDKMKCKIHIAMSDMGVLSKNIDENMELFKNIHIFAQTKEVNHRDYIVAEKRDALAIGVDYIYENIYPKVVDYDRYKYEYDFDGKKFDGLKYIDISDRNWSKLSYFKKESNRAVADHIMTKLKYIGLKIVPNSIQNKEILYKKNKDIFDEKISDVTLLAKCEHNRWSTFHYLQGYKPMPFISKKEKKDREKELENKKIHMCLIDFDDFKKKAKELKSFGYDEGSFEAYDVMIVEQIPQIVTYGGYELVKI